MKVALYTLGCKVNQYETQAMEQELRRRGHTLTEFEDTADVYIINTCAVTHISGHKSRQMIRQARQRNPAAVVGVCGCYAQVEPDQVARLGADLISGPDRRLAFLDDVEALARSREIRSGAALNRVGNIMAVRAFESLPAGGMEGRTRALLKVEDGCANFCSYCVIPYARGPVRSMPLDEATAQAARLAGEGYREIVITGIEISSWGRDRKDSLTLIDLIEAICGAAPSCRVRLGSLEPRSVTEEFCHRLSVLPNLCPHFHLSLQSGCDATLRRMNRKYDTAQYYDSVKILRDYFDRPGLTTDLITGFPGETEEEFAQTLDFLERCAFTAMHIFPFSRRSGTAADRMEGQVPRAVKEDRARRARVVADILENRYLQGWIGQTLTALFEEERDGFFRGYAPNYVEVRVTSREGLRNQAKQVLITAVAGKSLWGELT